jgi:cytoskeleton protein RodZ
VEYRPVHERLRQAREARGEDIAVMARRIGVGARLLAAIDDGRFGDLPTGLYARSAIRQYATALSFDPDEILSACDALLPGVEDPVTALARLRGLRPAHAPRRPAVATAVVPPRPAASASVPAWRPLAAVVLDGTMVAALLLAAAAATIPMAGSTAALGGAAAPVFAVLAVILGSCYFLFFGGIGSATAGERIVGMRAGRRHPRHVAPGTVVNRALRCAGRDVRYLVGLGAWAGALIRSGPSGEAPEPARSIRHATGQ